MGDETSKTFIHDLISRDLAAEKYADRVITRFPPEPNGYLHIGHAKSICLNFGLADHFGGRCHLRFDDTNPSTEDPEFVDSIQADIRWLGFDWGEHLYFASDYFDKLYAHAEDLVEKGLAYVDSSTEEEIRTQRGTVTEAGQESSYRGRSVTENLDLLRRMKDGEFKDGEHVLRAKIDMAAANMKMRDPLLYRIRHAHHYRTGDAWSIYPMYDFAHCLSDATESITHSLCTLEFENNRDIYDWVLEHTEIDRPAPEQTEFARLSMTYTILSKRKLLELVTDKHVSGWDDPRMPTISGLQRRGYTAGSIRSFCNAIGVAKANSTVDVAQLEHAIRDDLNSTAPRVLAVLRPLRVVIENYPEGQTEEMDAPYYPHDIPKEGSRMLPFSRVLYIERDDFQENPSAKFRRMAPGREIRLRYAYLVRCTEVIKDEEGEITEIRCTYDPETRGGNAPDGRKVQGTIHWVSEAESLPAEIHLYDRLFNDAKPDRGKAGEDFKNFLNPDSHTVLTDCRVERSLQTAGSGEHFQFERQGYFYTDPKEFGEARLVFNRTVTLRDTWQRKPGRPATEESPRTAKAAPPKPAPPQENKPVTYDLTPAQAEEVDRLTGEHALSQDDASLIARTEDLLHLFDASVAIYDRPSAIAKWIVNELLREIKSGSLDLSPEHLAELVELVEEGEISTGIGKEVLLATLAQEGSPRAIVDERGLGKISDPAALQQIVTEVLTEQVQKVEQYRAGKEALFGFFVGQVMKKSEGRADPKLARETLQRELDRG